MMSCGGKTLKCLVFFFNFLAFAAGVSILAGCLAARFLDPVQKYVLDKGDAELEDIIGDDIQNFHSLLYVGMVLGGFLIFIGFLGCCGALTENICMLTAMLLDEGYHLGLKRALYDDQLLSYAPFCDFGALISIAFQFIVIMCLILIAQIAIGAYMYVNRSELDTELKAAMTEFETQTTKADATNVDTKCEAWEAIQNSFKCCNTAVHETCSMSGCLAEQTEDCTDAIYAKFKEYAGTAAIICLVFLVLELAAVVFAACLCCAVKDGRNLYDD